MFAFGNRPLQPVESLKLRQIQPFWVDFLLKVVKTQSTVGDLVAAGGRVSARFKHRICGGLVRCVVFFPFWPLLFLAVSWLLRMPRLVCLAALKADPAASPAARNPVANQHLFVMHQLLFVAPFLSPAMCRIHAAHPATSLVAVS